MRGQWPGSVAVGLTLAVAALSPPTLHATAGAAVKVEYSDGCASRNVDDRNPMTTCTVFVWISPESGQYTVRMSEKSGSTNNKWEPSNDEYPTTRGRYAFDPVGCRRMYRDRTSYYTGNRKVSVKFTVRNSAKRLIHQAKVMTFSVTCSGDPKKLPATERYRVGGMPELLGGAPPVLANPTLSKAELALSREVRARLDSSASAGGPVTAAFLSALGAPGAGVEQTAGDRGLFSLLVVSGCPGWRVACPEFVSRASANPSYHASDLVPWCWGLAKAFSITSAPCDLVVRTVLGISLTSETVHGSALVRTCEKHMGQHLRAPSEIKKACPGIGGVAHENALYAVLEDYFWDPEYVKTKAGYANAREGALNAFCREVTRLDNYWATGQAVDLSPPYPASCLGVLPIYPPRPPTSSTTSTTVAVTPSTAAPSTLPPGATTPPVPTQPNPSCTPACQAP